MKMSILIVFSLVVCLILNTRILYFNIISHSLPPGIYIKTNAPPKIGEYAASCLTQEIADYGLSHRYLMQGGCSTGIVPVMKIIKGVPGSWYSNKDGVFKIKPAQQEYLLKSVDSKNRPLKIFYSASSSFVNKGNYLLLSTYVPNSWDSRYWGPVPINFVLEPLITW